MQLPAIVSAISTIVAVAAAAHHTLQSMQN